MNITNAKNSDWKKILIISKKLSKWFDKHAILIAIPNDIKFHKCLVAKDNDKILGFLIYSSYEGTPYISWIGIDPDYFRQGIGKKLINKFEKTLKNIGIKKYQVETLSETIDYKPYEGTRKFYLSLGFIKGKTRQFYSESSKETIELVTFEKEIIYE